MVKMKTISLTVVMGSVVSKSLAAVYLFRIGSQPERLFFFLLSLLEVRNAIRVNIGDTNEDLQSVEVGYPSLRG